MEDISSGSGHPFDPFGSESKGNHGGRVRIATGDGGFAVLDEQNSVAEHGRASFIAEFGSRSPGRREPRVDAAQSSAKGEAVRQSFGGQAQSF